MVPMLRVKLPRQITSLHQIELTNHCQLKCVYCPSPTMKRVREHMTKEHFLAALDWVRFLVNQRSQGELNLAGTGESTLHPDIIEFIGLAREALGPNQMLSFPTNGITLTKEIADACVKHDCKVFISMHQGTRAVMPAIQLARSRGILVGHSVDAALQPVDWAGQVEWQAALYQEHTCPWMREGWVFVLSNGQLSPCSFDADGVGAFGSVKEPPGSPKTQPYSLCRGCHQHINIIGYDQWGPEGIPKKYLPIVL